MKTIAIVNQKGGCGKTTVAINLASALAGLGQRVLLVDMDSQSHCAVGLAVPEEQIEQSIYDVLISRSRNEPVKLSEILWQISDGLELAPASIDMSAFEQQMAGVAERECCLKDTLDDVRDDYDYVVIDCPPAVGLLTFNALRAATDIIVPVETGYFALHGLSKQLETLSVLCKRTSQEVDVKVLATMYDIRTKMAREILAELRNHFGEKMLDTVITFNTKIKEASSFGQPISEYDPASKGQKDFRSLASEILSTKARQQRHDYVNSLAGQLESISATADELLKATQTPEKEVESILQDENILSDHTEREKEFASVEARAWEELESEVEEIEISTDQETESLSLPVEQTAEERTDAKLSDYYGVDQVNDAIVFVTLYPRAQNVQIAGDFNNWQPQETPMQKVGDSGVWQSELKLPAGRYRYRLVVDGQWQQDPYNELTEMNPFGEYNSVVEVK
ncbi:MAG: AAA family ATPase [Sedimentisphaerales bacterium]|nr:AAA family ATPase [Sedimentisphaerales bacterium]